MKSDGTGKALDELFDRALSLLQEGKCPTPAELAQGRPALESEVEGLLQLARSICPARPFGPPEVPGYTILHELGRGGMGVVWLARQERADGRLVALKTVPVFPLASSARGRAVQEASALASARHPNVVTLYEVIETEGVTAFAMELAGEQTLAGLLREADDSAEPWAVRVCTLGVALSQGLAHLHRLGILHRDLKPSNVLIREDGTPLLSDLGLASVPGAGVTTHSGEFLGTLAYASPEQLRGDVERIDERSDVYSLGSTLYHVLTRSLPADTRNVAESLELIEQRGPLPRSAFPRQVSSDLCAVIAKAMEPERDRRYQTADELSDDLQRILDLEPVEARPATAWYRFKRFVGRNRRSARAAAIGGALMALVGIALVLQVFLRPVYVDARLREARSLLLNPTYIEHVMVKDLQAAGWFEDGVSQPIAGDADVLERYRSALRVYDRVLRLTHDRDATGEREALGLALRLLEDESAQQLVSETTGELTRRFLDGWSTEAYLPRLRPSQLTEASPSELRKVGLLAYLCGNVGDCEVAWRRLGSMPGDDAFIDAAFGLVLLNQGSSGLAYPRLLVASQSFPDQDFLWVQLADAALMTGDLDQVEGYLEEADGRGPFDHRLLVEGDLAMMRGDWSTASTIFREHAQHRRNPRSRLHGAIAAMLADHHEFVRFHLAGLAWSHGGHPVHVAYSTWLFDCWWGARSRMEQCELVAASLGSGARKWDSLATVARSLADARSSQTASRSPREAHRLAEDQGEAWVSALRRHLGAGPSTRAKPLLLTFAVLVQDDPPVDEAPAASRLGLAAVLLALDDLVWALQGAPRLGDTCPLLGTDR